MIILIIISNLGIFLYFSNKLNSIPENITEYKSEQITNNIQINTNPTYSVPSIYFQGINGKEGDKGLVGPRGEKGERGSRGEKGNTGEKGEMGDPSYFSYGSFYDTTTQTNPVGNTARTITYNTTAEASGISITNNSEILFASPGVYNIQFSLQLTKTDSGTDFMDIWFVKNGNTIPDSNTRVTLIDKDYYSVAAWNYVTSMNAGDKLQLYWSSADTSMSISTQGPFTGPARPRIPSAILTVTQAK